MQADAMTWAKCSKAAAREMKEKRKKQEQGRFIKTAAARGMQILCLRKSRRSKQRTSAVWHWHGMSDMREMNPISQDRRKQ